MSTTGHGQLSEEQIESVERSLGLQFPRSLREYFLQPDRVRQDLCIYDDEEDERVGVVVHHRLSLSDGRENALAIYSDHVLKKELVPRSFFPFAVDPGGDILYVDCSSQSGSVYLWHHDTAFDPIIPFKIDLETFWSRLRPDE